MTNRRSSLPRTTATVTFAILGVASAGLPTANRTLPAQPLVATAEQVAEATATGEEAATEAAANVPERVEVDPINTDEQIAERLTEILEATGWFRQPAVVVDRGVAFLAGEADTEQHRTWAEATAIRTADVVAVVNRIEVAETPLWNFSPAAESMKELGRDTVALLPLVLIAAIIVLLSYLFAYGGALLTRRLTGSRVDSRLLRHVAGNVVGVLIFVIGVYIALRISGLTRLAVTLLGGTGLVGLALGFAFRDIAENYLASILISLNHPFRVGDLIEVDGSMGFVRTVTTRGTILNTLEGNQVQIPNSTVYKSKVLNYTATPLMRLNFTVGVGFDVTISRAQEIIMGVLERHEAVLKEPAPLVLVESLGAATVNLRCYYWFDQSHHSALKVGSSVIRMAKQALVEAGVTLPDEARELVFPDGVPVQVLEASRDGEITAEASPSQGSKPADAKSPAAAKSFASPDQAEMSEGEGGLRSEQVEVMKAAEEPGPMDGGQNLIA